MLIVFHGENAASFSDGFAGLLDVAADVVVLPDVLTSDVRGGPRERWPDRFQDQCRRIMSRE